MATGNDMGVGANIVVGIIGGFVCGLIVNLLGGSRITWVNFWSLFAALTGSAVLLWIVHAAKQKT